MGLKTEVSALYNSQINSGLVVITRYPIGVQGVLLTAGGVAWTLAAAGAGQIQVVAAGLNVAGMWLAGVTAYAFSAAGEFVIWVGRGTIAAAVRMAQVEFTVTAHTFAGAAAGSVTILQPTPATIMLPVWLFVPTGTGIALDVTSSNAAADTCRAGVLVATQVGS